MLSFLDLKFRDEKYRDTFILTTLFLLLIEYYQVKKYNFWTPKEEKLPLLFIKLNQTYILSLYNKKTK
jgi:hypothetical protein